MGDLHMPLHTGYDDDLGGNKLIVQYDTIKNHNLHTFWDVDIIKLTGIKDEDCIQYYDSLALASKTIDFTAWMKDSRSLLGEVYNYDGFTLDNQYLNRNKIVVEKQLIKAALRLAKVLDELFYTEAPKRNLNSFMATYKDAIDVKDAPNYVGKKVTVCTRVVAIKSSDAITQISLDEKFPNSPLTVIVFAKNYSKFPNSLEQLFLNQDVCLKGVVEIYKGKPQIILESPTQIIVLKSQ